MDLYMQIGILLLMGTGFALIVFYSADSMDTGQDLAKKLDREPESFVADNAYNNDVLTVDHRNLTQWVKQKSMSRDVYLVFYDGQQNLIEPLEPTGELLNSAEGVNLEVSGADPSLREVEFFDRFSASTLTAIKYQRGNLMDSYLTKFTNEVKITASNGTAIVYTFSRENSGEIVYLVTIQ